MRPFLAIAIAAAILASGCVRGPYEPAAPPTMPEAEAFRDPWPDPAGATIRPGVQLVTRIGEGQAMCTSNFLFRTPDNASLYLGVAAHCFGMPSDAAPAGTPVDVVGTDGTVFSRAGRVAYNGWAFDPSDRNDFGLVLLRNDPAVRGHVHPAVLHYGGPTGLQRASDVLPGAHVVTYGHSPQRAPNDDENPREGYVLQHEGGRTTVVTEHPGIQGDSGSGLMTVAGAALGVLSMGTTNPTNGVVANRDFPSVNYYVDLDQALQAAMVNDPALEGLEVVAAGLLEKARLPL